MSIFCIKSTPCLQFTQNQRRGKRIALPKKQTIYTHCFQPGECTVTGLPLLPTQCPITTQLVFSTKYEDNLRRRRCRLGRCPDPNLGQLHCTQVHLLLSSHSNFWIYHSSQAPLKASTPPMSYIIPIYIQPLWFIDVFLYQHPYSYHLA